MTKPLWLRIKLMAILLGLMIIVHVVNILMNEGLNQFGIQPRSITQWFHIFTAPFIHGDITHLINNLIGLSIFGGFCLIRSAKFFLYASLFIIAVSGLLVWLFARPGSYVGASGWIFGLWSLSIAMAWFDRRFLNIVLAVVVLFFYGSMIYGVLPSDSRVSFEAHFFGAVAGCMWAFVAIRFNSILFIQDKG